MLPAAQSWWRGDPDAAAERGNNCEAPWGRNDTPLAGRGSNRGAIGAIGFPEENGTKQPKTQRSQKVEKT